MRFLCEFRRYGARDKKRRKRREIGLTPGYAGTKLTTSLRQIALPATGVIGGLGAAEYLLRGGTAGQALRQGLKVGAIGGGVVSGVLGAAYLAGPRSPIPSVARARRRQSQLLARANRKIKQKKLMR